MMKNLMSGRRKRMGGVNTRPGTGCSGALELGEGGVASFVNTRLGTGDSVATDAFTRLGRCL